MAGNGITGRDIRTAILFGALVYLAIRFISQIADIILIFSVTVLVATVLDGPVSWLARHRIPRQVSATCIAIGFLVLVAVGLYLIIPPAGRQLQELWKQGPDVLRGARTWAQEFARMHPSIAQYLPERFSIDTNSVRQFLPALLGGAGRLTASAAGAIVSIVLVFIMTIYTLANPAPLCQGLLRVVGPSYRSRFESAGTRLRSAIRAWACGIVVAMIFIFLVTWVVLWFLGVKQAFLFALIAGLLEAVPIIGPILSAVPPVAVTLFSDPMLALWIIVAFIAIQQLENHLLVPLIMSRQLSLHPVTVIFAVLVMGGFFGIVGVFLASPAAVTAAVLLDELYLKHAHAQPESPVGG